jgi:hypothetical protein
MAKLLWIFFSLFIICGVWCCSEGWAAFDRFTGGIREHPRVEVLGDKKLDE